LGAISEYRAGYRAEENVPPLEVFEVEGELLIVDGFHRYEAAIRAGVATLPVNVVGEGTMGEAIREALRKNHRHGVRRTQADKRKAVEMALALNDGMSNRAIKRLCGVSHTFVANVRKGKLRGQQLEMQQPEPDADELRQEADGRFASGDFAGAKVAYEKALAATPLEDGAGLEECLRLCDKGMAQRKRAERITRAGGRCGVCGDDGCAEVSLMWTSITLCPTCLDAMRAPAFSEEPHELEAAE